MKQVEDVSRVDEILKALEFLDKYEIEIGIFTDDFKNSDGSLTIFGKAVVNEYGTTIEVTDSMRGYLHSIGIHLKKDTTEIIIPERSFIRGSFDANRSKIYKSIDEMLTDVIDGELTAKEMAGIIGQNGVDMIKDYIRAGIDPENSQITLQRKKGTTPLIDTGDMIKAIDWRIVEV